MRNVTLVRGMSLTAMAGGLFTGALLYLSRRWVVPPRVLLGAPEGGAAREVTFPSADGIPLYGWYLHAGVHAPALALCHGYQRCIEETLSLGYELHRRGFNVLLFDFRACGASGGRYTSIGYYEPLDLRGAIDWLRGLLGPRTPIGVLGISMGGSVALTAAADCPEVRAVVSDSAFATLRGAIAHRFARLRFPSLQLHYLSLRAAELLCRARADDVRPVDAVRRLGDVPVLLIHSEHDEIVPYSHALELDAALTGPHELWTTTGVRHAMMRFALADEYLERVSGFFYRHLHTAAAAVS